MGIVFSAWRARPIERHVALEILRPTIELEDLVAQFEFKRQCLVKMNHPSIAQIYDSGTAASDRPYFVMELVRGQPIDEYCHEHELGIRDCLKLVVAICEGLHHAPQRGIMNRDLQPMNVIVSEVDGVPAAKIIDFGMGALTTRANLEGREAIQGRVAGTPKFLSSEQRDPTCQLIGHPERHLFPRCRLQEIVDEA